jgi:hypothetical protein
MRDFKSTYGKTPSEHREAHSQCMVETVPIGNYRKIG